MRKIIEEINSIPCDDHWTALSRQEALDRRRHEEWREKMRDLNAPRQVSAESQNCMNLWIAYGCIAGIVSAAVVFGLLTGFVMKFFHV